MRRSPPQPGETAAGKLNLALELERRAILRLNRGIPLCLERAANGSRDLLQEIFEGEEQHADWLETQLELISQIGESRS
jgi:bacterioferritin